MWSPCAQDPDPRGWGETHTVPRACTWGHTSTVSSILAWRIPWTEEPGGLQSTGLQRVGHDSTDLACVNEVTDSGSSDTEVDMQVL